MHLLFARSFPGLIATYLLTLLLTAILWGTTASLPLLGWAGFTLVVTSARLTHVCRFLRRRPPDVETARWERWFLVGAVAGSGCWALASGLLFLTPSLPHQALIVFTIGGVTGGGVATLNNVLTVYRSFALIAVTPTVVNLLTFGTAIHFSLALMLTAFALLWLHAAKTLNAGHAKTFALGFDNAALAHTLAEANTDMTRINHELRDEVQEKIIVQNALRVEKERAQVTLESIGDGVITTDVAGNIKYLNPVATQLTGCSLAYAQDRHVNDVLALFDERTHEPIGNALEFCRGRDGDANAQRELLLVNRERGTEYSIEITKSPILGPDDQPIGKVLVIHDITELRGLAKQMSYQARHDPLTGLINRREFESQLKVAVMTARNDNKHHALMYLDLDQFKVVNDSCGHVAGDEFLKQLAPRLLHAVREEDVLARLGGDEFGILLHHCGLDNAHAVARKISDAVQGFHFMWQGRSFDVGVSIGLVAVTEDVCEAAELMSAADAACYVAKDQGRNRIHVYMPNDEIIAQRHGEMQWVQKIKQALKEDRFRLYYQSAMPVNANDGRAVYCEFLLRLIDEHGKLVPPMTFIPAAERYQLMPAVDRWVVETAFKNIANKTPAIAGFDIFAINLSGQSLSDEYFLDFVLIQLADWGIEPERICFEITETAAIANFQKASNFISRMRDMGCRFALDDFGSGLSSFAYLKSLAVDFIKIDGAFVKDMVADSLDRAMVQAIKQIGYVMGKTTIAEFVENDAILTQLGELGVDYAQGYGIARPQPLNPECDSIAPISASN